MLLKVDYVQIIDDRPVQPDYIRKCMQSVETAAREPTINGSYRVIRIPYDSDIVKTVNFSDRIRLSLAAQLPNMCYVDSDVLIIKPLSEFVKNTPYFGRMTLSRTETFPDYNYFFVNGNCDYFRDNLPPDCVEEGKHGIDGDRLRELAGYELIDESSYVHLYATMLSASKRRRGRRESRDMY